MKTIGERLRLARKEAKLTQQQLAQHMGVTKSAISQVELGISKGLSHASLVRACRALDLNPEWLSLGKGNMRPFKPSAHHTWQVMEGFNNRLESSPRLSTSVPLINWVQAGEWEEIADTFQLGDAEKWRDTTARVGPHAFALCVQGDSMTSLTGLSIPEGSVVIVDPDASYSNGSIVVAKLADAVEATLKKLIIDGPNKYLKSLNPAYTPIPISDNCRIIGVAKKVEIDL
ncbi:LexA family protein [Microbulbifer thermotolerans]|uniref:LexA family protein n=1 Tax=Microbulbifer thermotolerans TaxID=252514 RepID=UPI00224AF6BC|nr:XRE family transcriptional regulator [Microbulbifer thermotolerans]MCX2780903.1 XRE family transcriptional regulator [Microbulbifer thermotolerans]MCX2804868.1 XRE family transcriptional regulator [Microbulbifer thermotolerans]